MAHGAVWVGEPHIKGRSEPVRMMLLCTGLIGLQLAWGLEMTYCMPYLLELGLSKSRTTLVWVAGPLSGIVVAPLIGAIADKSKSRWGRRRPFMIGGSLAVAICFFVLAWAREILSLFNHSASTTGAAILVAILSIYAIDFAINVVQWSIRGLIVDSLPVAKQQYGSAWAGRMAAFGHLLGYAIGSMDLKVVFGTLLGSTQFKQMTVISAVFIVGANCITAYAVTEKILIAEGDGYSKQTGGLALLRRIFHTTLRMPRRIAGICWIQFWAWIGWFPFLFYSSEWVGEIYFQYSPEAPADSADRSGDIGRVGSTALLVYSMVTFIGSIVLPMLIQNPEDDQLEATHSMRAGSKLKGYLYESSKPDLPSAYLVSHLMFAVSMILAPLVRSFRFAALLVAICGIPWAFANWAPFAFIGMEINKIGYSRISGEAIEMHSGDVRGEEEANEEEDQSSKGAMAGIYLGVLNLFTAGPQFIGAFISTVVFHIFEPGASKQLTEGKMDEGQRGANGIGICLFIAALSAMGAAYATYRFKKIS